MRARDRIAQLLRQDPGKFLAETPAGQKMVEDAVAAEEGREHEARKALAEELQDIEAQHTAALEARAATVAKLTPAMEKAEKTFLAARSALTDAVLEHNSAIASLHLQANRLRARLRNEFQRPVELDQFIDELRESFAPRARDRWLRTERRNPFMTHDDAGRQVQRAELWTNRAAVEALATRIPQAISGAEALMEEALTPAQLRKRIAELRATLPDLGDLQNEGIR